MKFPTRFHAEPGAFAEGYIAASIAAMRSIDLAQVAAAVHVVETMLERDGTLYACGNGGSASISDHLVCDYVKAIRGDTTLASRAHALTTNTALISAIANDLSYGDVFAYQIESFARPGDVVMVVSSSGDSENIVRAIDTAKKLGLDTIALTGFDGGRARRIANVAIHVELSLIHI